jgi:beta-barrel assembly-enhancing protease
VPVEWERSVGAATAAAVIGGGRVCDAPEGRAALDALVAKLAAAGGMAATAPVRARVVDDPTVNALAAPGGEILVYRGLLDRAASADELAGVLAHEIGHVEHRHGLRGVARAAGLFVLTGALSGGSDAVALAAVLVGLSYSRDFEREADASGARILAAAGIGTKGLEMFFARMERERSGASGSLWSYLGTHPADGDRAAALRAAEQPAAPAPAMSAAEWAALRGICGSAREQRQRVGPNKSGRSVRAARAQTRPLGTFANWEAWTKDDGKNPMCYALAYALSAEGEERGGRSKLWVTHRPWYGMDDISFEPDRKPPDGAAMWIEFGAHRSAMRMNGRSAWPRDTASLSAALRGAAAEGVSEAVIAWSEAVKGQGAPTRTFRFALGGLVEAHAAITEACEDAP